MVPLSGSLGEIVSYITFTMWRHWWRVCWFLLYAMFHIMVSGFHIMVSGFHIMVSGFHNMVFGIRIMVSGFHIMFHVQRKSHNAIWNVAL